MPYIVKKPRGSEDPRFASSKPSNISVKERELSHAYRMIITIVTTAMRIEAIRGTHIIDRTKKADMP
jgi:hypothetical protein|tara:strand:+ start:606945 stop:607145 length:201 start_codon:yes stop_codon:yes gene_type:complete